nr:LysR family transcriptional regulator [uncultured Anaeromusa sp.]
MQLTHNGERILSHIKMILHHEEHLREEALSIKGIETGLVRIGTLSSISIKWVPSILASFHSQYPQSETKTHLGCYDGMNKWISSNLASNGSIVKKRLR